MSDETTDSAVNRLHDMTVEEVSLVDRAANKRRFLVTKRKDGAMATEQTELQPDGNGGLTSTPADSAPVAEPAVADAPAPAVETPTELAPDTAKANGTDGPLQSAVDRLMSVANKVKEGAPVVAVAGELKQIATLLVGMTEKYPSPKAKADADAEETDLVKKRGSKMRKDRLDRFKGAVKALADLLKEIEPEDLPQAEAVSPSAGAAQTAKADEPPPVEAIVKVDVSALAPMTEQVSKLAGMVEGLAGAMKEQKDRLDRVAKATPTSSQVPVEPRGEGPARDVSWPLDMNRPVDRDHVAKDVSFHSP